MEVRELDKKMKCHSCGAEYDAALTKCPYCGELNYNSAEREYMDKLSDVREDLEDLEEVPAEEVRSQTSAQGKRILRIVRRTALILAAVLVVFFLITWWSNTSYERDTRADYLWKQENFPTMDAYYEAGDYAGLYTFIRESLDQDQPAWDWSHYADYEAYDTMLYVENCIEEADAASKSRNFYTFYLYEELRMHTMPQWTSRVSDQFQEQYAGNIAAIEEDLQTRWGLDEQGIDALIEDAEIGFVDYDACKAYVKKWYPGKGEN